jgi:hypothetical protein
MQLMPMISNFAKHAKEIKGALHREDKVCASTNLPAPKGNKVGQAYTTGCGGETMFDLPVVDEHDDGTEFNHITPAVVCVVDDMAYMFPKYGGDDFDVPDPSEDE